jgi:hypothetical protein
VDSAAAPALLHAQPARLPEHGQLLHGHATADSGVQAPLAHIQGRSIATQRSVEGAGSQWQQQPAT